MHSHPLPASVLATALSWGFSSTNIKSAKLTLTPHHLYYLLTQIEELGVTVGPLTVRLENIHTDSSPTNYVSFLGQQHRSRSQSDGDSVHSMSSVRSVVSSLSSMWSLFAPNVSKNNAMNEKARTQSLGDVTYLYSAFTKLPCLKLAPDPNARPIKGYEEFPFDAAVPLTAFKNLSALEITDIDFRRFYGWNILAEQLKSLTLRRACVDDPADALIAIVLDDIDKRRRRSFRTKASPTSSWPTSPTAKSIEQTHEQVSSLSPVTEESISRSRSAQNSYTHHRNTHALFSPQPVQVRSILPMRPKGSSQYSRANAPRIQRSESVTSTYRGVSKCPSFDSSNIDLMSMEIFPATKWRFLRHLCLADNALTYLAASSLAPLEQNLKSLDVSSNLFTEIPGCLATLTNLKALNISNCMIDSLCNLTRCPLERISAINLRANRLVCLAGIEGSMVLERLDIRENRIHDSAEFRRLADLPHMQELWIVQNPCTHSQRRYRIDIFNLFRISHGLSKDVIIDGTGPTYSEKRQLKEHSTPIHGISSDGEAPPTTYVVTAGNVDSLNEHQYLSRKCPPPPTYGPLSDVVLKSGKHGRDHRIVDLSRAEGRQGKEKINKYAVTVHNPPPQTLAGNEEPPRLSAVYA
ncbi:uncharacterized protein KY384_008327 [Bacidia gigantensis]|uniref:uncharacterized protein n=1 Tax=Bacidia gigantensis TaxID=2732470 RepID=UPI001D03BFA9|nr:uncharacterized protein KY384_008327 [Bacidia gigantensis]KAG8526898.1 hypothetical protein KY384_008327 [Bacidia gigantensis]